MMVFNVVFDLPVDLEYRLTMFLAHLLCPPVVSIVEAMMTLYCSRKMKFHRRHNLNHSSQVTLFAVENPNVSLILDFLKGGQWQRLIYLHLSKDDSQDQFQVLMTRDAKTLGANVHHRFLGIKSGLLVNMEIVVFD
ncbi:hypothetical protein Tco_0542588 [Tanacetum coccineum]